MIKKIIISGGREVGGLRSFANGLAEGFKELGYEVEILSFRDILLHRKKELRDKNILKILSTGSAFLTPFSKSSIVVAHGIPRKDAQSFLKVKAIILSFRIAAWLSVVVSVSGYVQKHLGAYFGIKSLEVVANPISKIFADRLAEGDDRPYITYIGRFHKVKNIGLFIEPLKAFLDQHEKMSVKIIGDGEERQNLLNAIDGDDRFEIISSLEQIELKAVLNKTKVFFSGCETEALGISYIEALSQGANVVMPYSGGGLEIAPELIGSHIFAYSLAYDETEILKAIRNAHAQQPVKFGMVEKFGPAKIAQQYIDVFTKHFDVEV